MAIWQCSFHIIPKLKGSEIKTSEFGLLDDEELWKEVGVSPLYFEDIALVLKKNKSWSDNIDLYGQHESNRFEVFLESGVVAGVTFRIDFRTDYEKVLKGIIEFCIKKELSVLDSDLKPLTLNFLSLNTKITNSHNKDNFERLSEGRAPNLDFLKNENKEGFNS